MLDDIWRLSEPESMARSKSFALEVIHNGVFVGSVGLKPDVTYIGRMPENHVVIDDPKVSRSHARIICEQGSYVLEDQDSENGTFVNGSTVASCVLHLGDRIALGQYVLVVVEAAGISPSNPADHLAAGEHEWQEDRTVSITNPMQHDEILKKLSVIKTKNDPLTSNVELSQDKHPVVSVDLRLGSRSIQKNIVLEKGRHRQEKDPQGNYLIVQLGYGPFVMTKKVSLEE